MRLFAKKKLCVSAVVRKLENYPANTQMHEDKNATSEIILPNCVQWLVLYLIFLLHSLEDDTFYTDTCNLFQNIELQVSG